jgi:hypothetical protein
MDRIAHMFFESYSSYQPGLISEYYSNVTENNRPDVEGGKYMSNRVYGYIRNRLHHKIEKEYIFDNTRVMLIAHCMNNQVRLEGILYVLNYYIHTLNKVAHRPVIKIVLYLTNLKKLFPPTPNVVLNEDNVNSGMTMYDGGDRMIVIYRREELFKVLLHELIHLYELDFFRYDPKYDSRLITKHGIRVQEPCKNPKNPLALYESYTDTFACYGQMAANILLQNRTGNTMNSSSFASKLKALRDKETTHYALQAAKIMKYSNAVEDTHCFAYYIVKSVIYANFEIFIQFVNNTGIKLDTVRKHEQYLELVCSLLDDPKSWRMLKKVRTNKIVLSSLKMSKVKWNLPP